MALGENKTLKYLNLDSQSSASSSVIDHFSKALAMNAYRNGALEAVSIV
jgi:hypothetical protein